MFYDNLNDEVEYYKSEYFEGFSSESYNLIVCIENYDDEPFWSFIFSKVENIQPVFLYMDGKTNILKFEIEGCLDNEFVACVDSDYDYILKNPYLENPYIFHTYVYAVENYCVCAKTLNSLKSSLNIFCNLDFESLFSKMTPIIKEALAYDIYLHNGDNVSCQREVFKFSDISYENFNEEFILTTLKDKVSLMLESVDSACFFEYKNIINEDPNIDENFLHLYTEGHIVFDSIFNVLDKVQNENIHSKIRDIGTNNDYLGDRKKHKINELNNKKFDIKTALKLNYKEAFYNNHCVSFQKVIEDIKISMEGIT